jgi:hypothetical protein
VREKKHALVQQLKSFLELYQTFSITDYDIWDHVNGPRFGLFVDKFEKEAQALEVRAS